MRTIMLIVQKEFIQVFRNKMMLPIIFVIPIIQLLILVHAATFEMKQIRMYIVDNDLSSASLNLANKFDGSPFFIISGKGFSMKEAEKQVAKGKADVILNIPHDFERSLVKDNKGNIQLVVNAINQAAAGLVNAYSLMILQDYNRQLIAEWVHFLPPVRLKSIDIASSYWYNPKLNYKTYMVPGILVLLVTIIGLLLSGMNVVREKEIGTIEQINVTPIKKYQFISGKLLPFWIIALFELAFGLAVGKLMFNIPIVGSLWVVFGVAGIYLLVILGFGLFISTLTNTQQQSMLLSFFILIIFVLMSGLFTPVESMPDWAQAFNRINPLAYFIRVMRMVLLQGAGFRDITREIYSLSVYAVIIISLAVWRYRKTV